MRGTRSRLSGVQQNIPPPPRPAPPPPAEAAVPEYMEEDTEYVDAEITRADLTGDDSDIFVEPSENGGVRRERKPMERRPKMKLTAEGRIRKKEKQKKLIQKMVQPKNPIQCIMPLNPNYILEETPGFRCCATLQLNGETYKGYGSSKVMAKQAAAEAFLMSFVNPGNLVAAGRKQDDKTPWDALASYALYKLFTGETPRSASSTDSSVVAGPVPQTPASDSDMKDQSVFGSPVLPAQRPARKVPDHAESMHPTMVLTQLRPDITFNSNRVPEGGDVSKMIYEVTTLIDGKEFKGKASNIKNAKFHLCKAALMDIYQIDSIYELPGKGAGNAQ